MREGSEVEKVFFFFYLLRQLEILNQVLLALSQLKYSLQRESKFEKKKTLVDRLRLIWVIYHWITMKNCYLSVFCCFYRSLEVHRSIEMMCTWLLTVNNTLIQNRHKMKEPAAVCLPPLVVLSLLGSEAASFPVGHRTSRSKAYCRGVWRLGPLPWKPASQSWRTKGWRPSLR